MPYALQSMAKEYRRHLHLYSCIISYLFLFVNKIQTFVRILLKLDKFENFIKTPKQKRKVEEYTKYLAISIVFHFRRIFLRLMADGESKLNEILACLTTEGKKLCVVNEWLTEAIDHIPDQELKTISLNHWNDIKNKFDANEFDLTKLF